jgi:molecular chaperone DnaK (HSP70)
MPSQITLLKPNGAKIQRFAEQVRVLGIDLGTTNSTVAEIVWKGESGEALEARCLPIDQPTATGVYTDILVPSAVAIWNDRIIVGEGAKRLRARVAEPRLENERSLFIECKNDIGTLRTYHRAPEGFRSAAEIAGKVLAFLKAAAEKQDKRAVISTVVTVPASFQAGQRLDTVTAAKLAGIDIHGGKLLDEPIAAFLDYLMLHPDKVSAKLTQRRNLLVFDFGGGTCDVAIFHLKKTEGQQILKISPVAVSRYHRLGGGDIDRAIVYEVLVPQLLAQNQIGPYELTFEEKKNFIEPAYLMVAESLKTGLCDEMTRLENSRQCAFSDKTELVKRLSGVYECCVSGRTIGLRSPSLAAAEFETILKPFLDRDLLYARETEYRLTCSIFAPIQDTLERARLSAGEIDLCLLVGGSSLIPQVRQAVAGYFPSAALLSYDDKNSVRVAVARGAAYHALALQLYGSGVFEFVSHERIAIRTDSGLCELIPRGASLPFPSKDHWARTEDLRVPNGSIVKPVPLLVDIVAGEAGSEQTLFTATWSIPAPVNRGDSLILEYRIDENQVFEFRLWLADDPKAETLTGRIENPLSNVVNPSVTRLRIQRAEEDLKVRLVPESQIPDKLVEIAEDYAELRQLEKANFYLKQALRIKRRPDSRILHLLGMYHGQLGDAERQEKFYREAAELNLRDDGPLFNLALAQNRRKKFDAADATIDECLKRRRSGPALTLKSEIASSLGQPEVAEIALRNAFEAFEPSGCREPVKTMNDWELGWYLHACDLARDEAKAESARQEQRRRKERTSMPASGQLPMMAHVLVKT